MASLHPVPSHRHFVTTRLESFVCRGFRNIGTVTAQRPSGTREERRSSLGAWISTYRVLLKLRRGARGFCGWGQPRTPLESKVDSLRLPPVHDVCGQRDSSTRRAIALVAAAGKVNRTEALDAASDTSEHGSLRSMVANECARKAGACAF
eukprot:scaffold1146_cov399-Prasinococcus_capsulatus_cf.AAC.19